MSEESELNLAEVAAERDRLAEQYSMLKSYALKIEQEHEETLAHVAMLRGALGKCERSATAWQESDDEGDDQSDHWTMQVNRAASAALSATGAAASKWLEQHDGAVLKAHGFTACPECGAAWSRAGHMKAMLQHDDAVRAEEREACAKMALGAHGAGAGEEVNGQA